jgi:arsenate reductase
MKKVLFICVHNAGRSQMAEAFFNRLAYGRASASSAGTRPALHIDKGVVASMLDVGIDIRGQRPKPLDFEMIEAANRVITMGCGAAESCPALSTTAEDWELEDPEGKSPDEVNRIRDEIKRRVTGLVDELLPPSVKKQD